MMLTCQTGSTSGFRFAFYGIKGDFYILKVYGSTCKTKKYLQKIFGYQYKSTTNKSLLTNFENLKTTQ